MVDFLKVSRRLANPVVVFLMSLFLPHGRFSYRMFYYVFLMRSSGMVVFLIKVALIVADFYRFS